MTTGFYRVEIWNFSILWTKFQLKVGKFGAYISAKLSWNSKSQLYSTLGSSLNYNISKTQEILMKIRGRNPVEHFRRQKLKYKCCDLPATTWKCIEKWSIYVRLNTMFHRIFHNEVMLKYDGDHKRPKNNFSQVVRRFHCTWLRDIKWKTFITASRYRAIKHSPVYSPEIFFILVSYLQNHFVLARNTSASLLILFRLKLTLSFLPLSIFWYSFRYTLPSLFKHYSLLNLNASRLAISNKLLKSHTSPEKTTTFEYVFSKKDLFHFFEVHELRMG